MAKTKVEKKNLIDGYKVKLKNSNGMVILRPSRLTPKETTELKKELFDSNAEFRVVKNSLFKIALKELELPEIQSLESGEHAVLFLSEDIVTPSKTLKKFIDSTKTKDEDAKIEIIGAILEGGLLTKEQASEIAEMPDKKGSISMILGILDQAMASVVNVLEDAPRSYVTILEQAFKDKA